MGAVVLVIAVYFIGGLLALLVLDLLTKRIRTKLGAAAEDARYQMLATGSFISSRAAFTLTCGALWLLWPIAIWGALSTIGKGGQSGQEE